MTTFVAFTPSNTGVPFQANVTLDGNLYSLTASWNLAAQRWYLTITDTTGNLVWSGGLVGSPLTSNIYLALGIFTTSTILYREDTGNFEINP